jgi:hypothetical protein
LEVKNQKEKNQKKKTSAVWFVVITAPLLFPSWLKFSRRNLNHQYLQVCDRQLSAAVQFTSYAIHLLAAGCNPAIMFDLSDPLEYLNQTGHFSGTRNDTEDQINGRR